MGGNKRISRFNWQCIILYILWIDPYSFECLLSFDSLASPWKLSFGYLHQVLLSCIIINIGDMRKACTLQTSVMKNGYKILTSLFWQ